MSRNYDNPDFVTYSYPVHDFGAGAGAFAIKAPDGYRRGKLVDVGVNVTETFTATTTPGYVRVGTATDADAYAQLGMGVAADTNYWNTQDDPDAIIDAGVPADSQIEVAMIAPTGGTPAGKGTVNIIIAWW